MIIKNEYKNLLIVKIVLKRKFFGMNRFFIIRNVKSILCQDNSIVIRYFVLAKERLDCFDNDKILRIEVK